MLQLLIKYLIIKKITLQQVHNNSTTKYYLLGKTTTVIHFVGRLLIAQ